MPVFADAVRHFWAVRDKQATANAASGRQDQGTRSAVTGGRQMDGFTEKLRGLLEGVGVPGNCIYARKAVELPGYFRPTKQWDLLVVIDHRLVAAIELKSQVGPSFGNNFNNRTEEAMGTALDIWTAYREGAFKPSPQPWVGYLLLLEDCARSNEPVAVSEPHFPIFPEFSGASYAKRYELFCQKLVRERHYSGACFLMADPAKANGPANYTEPCDELASARFIAGLLTRAQLR